jgi:uncharacterized protein
MGVRSRIVAVAAAATACLLGFAGPASADLTPENETEGAIAETNTWWANHFSEFFGGAYSAPYVYPGQLTGYPGIYDSGLGEAPVCGGTALGPLNAFYCIPDDYVAFDDQLLLQRSTGDAFIYLVVAHEWGHAIQARISPQLVPQWIELQADCFAGAEIAGAVRDGLITWEKGDSQEVHDALVELADKTPWTDNTSHGDPQQRIDFFNYGNANGALACLPAQ